MPLSPTHPKPVDPVADDELDELPPMDGDGDDDDDPAEEELEDELGDAGDPYDDSTGEGDPLDDIEVEGAESGWLEDAAEAEGLDVGAPDLGDEDEESSLDAGEEGMIGDDDLVIGGDEAQPGVDAGEEGFEEEEEPLREEDLPRLDSGDDDETDDAHLGDGWIIGQDEADEARPGWDDRVWERAGAPLSLGAVSVDAVACAGRVAIAAGQGLSRVDLEGGVEPIEALGVRGGDVRSIFAEGSWLALTTARGGVFVSNDGGGTFVEANGWKSCVARGDADASLDVIVTRETSAAGRAAPAVTLWGRTRSGALVRSVDGGLTWNAISAGRRVTAMAASESGLVVLGLDDAPPGTRGLPRIASVGRAVGDVFEWTPVAALPEPVLENGEAGISMSARGENVAVCVAGRGVFRASPGAWARVDGTASATSCTYTGESGVLLIALYSVTEERAWLARATAGAARIVAEIGEASSEDNDARVRALVWDDAHGVVWAAGGFGLGAFHPAQLSSKLPPHA